MYTGGAGQSKGNSLVPNRIYHVALPEYTARLLEYQRLGINLLYLQVQFSRVSDELRHLYGRERSRKISVDCKVPTKVLET